MAPTMKYAALGTAIDERGLSLYPQEEWDKVNAEYDKRGICFELNCMLEDTITDLFGTNPELFEGANWINDDNGLPLWVREGVEWKPDTEVDED